MFVKYAAFSTPVKNTWSGLNADTQYAYIYGVTDLDLVSFLILLIKNFSLSFLMIGLCLKLSFY